MTMRDLLRLSTALLTLTRSGLAASSSTPSLDQYSLSCLNSTGSSQPYKADAPLNWQIVLAEPLDLQSALAQASSDTGTFDIDLFENPTSTIQELGKRGKRVLCYFSAGSYEKWRSDAHEFQDSDLGKPLDGWPGERWLNTSSPNVRRVMSSRIKLAKEKGCYAIDPDNVDGYQNDNGLELTRDDSVSFVKFLAAEARAEGLLTGLKNAGGIIDDVIDDVQFEVNEQCVQYSECDTFLPFSTHDKPIFHIEYPPSAPNLSKEDIAKFCGPKGKSGFSTVLKKMDLGNWVYQCNKAQATTCQSASSQPSPTSGASRLLPFWKFA